MRTLINLMPLPCDANMKHSSIAGVVDPLDETLFLELIDDSRHRAEANIERRREFPHRPQPLKEQSPQYVGLRYRQPSIQRIVQPPELVQLCEIVQAFIEEYEIGRFRHRINATSVVLYASSSLMTMVR